MFFRIASPVANKFRQNTWVLHNAKLIITTFKITPACLKLNNYLWQQYGLNLKTASLMVVAHCRLQKNNSNELIVTFPIKKIDKLASIITYGNGKIQGCSILQEAFGKI